MNFSETFKSNTGFKLKYLTINILKLLEIISSAKVKNNTKKSLSRIWWFKLQKCFEMWLLQAKIKHYTSYAFSFIYLIESPKLNSII